MKLIDADALLKRMQEDPLFDLVERYGVSGVINAEPTVEAEPVRHGKWEWLSCTYDRVPKEKEYACSNCHHKTIVHGDDMPWEKYCPNCGAKMDGERKEE